MSKVNAGPEMTQAGPRSRFSLQIPEHVLPEAYVAGLLASALVVVAGMTTLLLTAVLFARTTGVVAHPDHYTVLGQAFFHPEHETRFFLAACVGCVVLTLVQTIAWNGRLRHGPAPVSSRGWLGWAGVSAGGAGALGAGFLAFLIGRHYVLRNQTIPVVDLIGLVVVAGTCVAVGALGIRTRFSWYPRWLGLTTWESVDVWSERRQLALTDFLVPVAVVAILFVPNWRILSGRVFQIEALYHWDAFSMGTTTAFIHGQALGTGVHTEYGVGWPVLFGLMRPLLSVTYGHMILVASITACLYFIGVYVLLRMVTGAPGWAAAGTLLAVLLQVFSGNPFVGHLRGVAWQFPSISVIRRPLDVWVFLALALHLRTKRRLWAVAAGGLTGLAVVFSTDTGLYLVAVVVLYWLLVGMGDGRQHVLPMAGSAVAAIVVCGVGLGIGSRWTLFSVAFWRAWYEPINQGAAGYTALPMVGRQDIWQGQLPGPAALAGFVVVVVVYLTVLCYAAIKALHRRAGPSETLLGCVSAYGLLSLISFLGRSDPLELPHLLVPFAVVITFVAALGHRRLLALRPRPASGPGIPRAALAAIPLLLACVLGLALFLNPNFQDYPGVLQTIGQPSHPDGRCLMTAGRDVCGLPDALAQPVGEFRAVVADVSHLASIGRVAIIDEQVTYSVGANVAPWGPYVPLLVNLFDRSQVAAAQAQLLRERPTFVLIRPAAAAGFDVVDTATSFRDLLQRTYTLDHTVGSVEIYKSRSRL